MKLCCVKKNRSYKILNILIYDEATLNLINDLGLYIGNYVMVLSYSFFKRDYLICVNGKRHSIDKSICEKIFVNAL